MSHETLIRKQPPSTSNIGELHKCLVLYGIFFIMMTFNFDWPWRAFKLHRNLF